MSHRSGCFQSVPFCTALFIALGSVLQAEPRTPAPSPAPATSSGIKDYARGVRIDWTHRSVELSASVVLRKGPLELLACSPQTREHESIFVVPARPLHVYQAMGLIGLEPGRPAYFDESKETWIPPSGAPVEIAIRCDDRPDKVLSPRGLLKSTQGGQEVGAVDWVFAGSARTDNDRFAADLDGTLICLVDFESTLITVADLHSSDNEQLWLQANTDAIPPIGTACTISIKAKADRIRALRLVLRSDGTLQCEGKDVSLIGVGQMLRDMGDDVASLRIVVSVDGATPAERVTELHRVLSQAGVPAESIRVSTGP